MYRQMHRVKVTNLSKLTKFSTLPLFFAQNQQFHLSWLLLLANRSHSGPIGTLAALGWPLTSVKTRKFGPKVLQLVDFLTGRVILNLYGRIRAPLKLFAQSPPGGIWSGSGVWRLKLP